MTHTDSAGRWLGVSDARHGEVSHRIARDVEELFNHLSLRVGAPSASVLEWGLPNCAGRTVDEEFLHELAKSVSATLTHFEPRLEPQSIRVTPQLGAKYVRSRCGLMLQAMLRRPVPGPASDELSWQIRVDANFGRVAVTPLGASVLQSR